jgi:hypothetical protein
LIAPVATGSGARAPERARRAAGAPRGTHVILSFVALSVSSGWLRLGNEAKSFAERGHDAGLRAKIMFTATRKVKMRFAGD